jgi:hypothetical protein
MLFTFLDIPPRNVAKFERNMSFWNGHIKNHQNIAKFPPYLLFHIFVQLPCTLSATAVCRSTLLKFEILTSNDQRRSCH